VSLVHSLGQEVEPAEIVVLKHSHSSSSYCHRSESHEVQMMMHEGNLDSQIFLLKNLN